MIDNSAISGNVRRINRMEAYHEHSDDYRVFLRIRA